MTADGHLDIELAQWVGFRKITITPNPNVETVSAPSITAISANNGERTIEISGGSTTKEGASIVSYRYTIDGSEPSATLGTLYDAQAKIVINNTTTIKAVAISSSGKASAVLSQVIEAGTAIKLVTPTATFKGMNEIGNIAYPIYNFTSDNSALIGSPTATLNYTFVPTSGSETSGTLSDGTFAFTSTGTLTVTATASGYASSNGNEQKLENAYYQVSFYDFSALSQDILTEGEKANIDNASIGSNVGTRGYVFDMPRTLDQFTFSTDGSSGGAGWQLTWAITADKAYGVGIHGSSRYYVKATMDEGQIGIFNTKNSGKVLYTTSGSEIRFYNQEVLFGFTVYAKLPATVSVPVGTTGFATYANHDFALDFTNVSGLTAFTATVNGNEVTFTPATKVPAGTGVLLKGATADVPVIASADAISDNILFAPTADVTGLNYDADNYYNYILTQPSGKEVGFYRANNNSVAAGKAYLRIAKSAGARQFTFIGLNGETTGIEAINTTEQKNGEVYNLQGQRVAKTQKGLYIVNGKKVIMK